MPSSQFFVYILGSRSRTIYIGRTTDLTRRLDAHRRGLIPGFSKKYKLTMLMHFEATDSAVEAIARERQLKSWSRAKKIELIERANLGWRDLAVDWFGTE